VTDPKWNVVIVEDSATQAQRLQIILENAGYRVLAAKNGRDALSMIGANRPDLVISDITMPVMDGYALCREIKQSEELKDIPVILLTALLEPVEAIRALEVQADYFITKPYSDEYLISKIERLRVPPVDSERDTSDGAAEVLVGDERHVVTTGRREILKLLLSTYENAVEQNRQLTEANQEVQRLNEQLGDKLVELKEEVAERMRAEENLKGTMADLARSNSDLEQFAYVVSHDLQEPLRKIMSFADILQKRHEQALTGKARDYLERMVGAAGRMSRLIHDVLSLSRLATRAQPFDDVDMNQVVQTVLSDLEARIHTTNGRVEVDPLPVIEADNTQMRQLMQNLIGNALKFHKEDEPPVVQVGCQTEQGVCRISVADNGIGFDSKHREQIFTIFRRLHTRGAYEGTGIGLAICRKIAERHRGSIAATGEPGRGATFTVSLPVRQPGAALK